MKLVEAAGTADIFDLINSLDRAVASCHQLFDTLNEKGEISPDLPGLIKEILVVAQGVVYSYILTLSSFGGLHCAYLPLFVSLFLSVPNKLQ